MAHSKLRRAQAAIEFLMTYGWAIIVVLIGIGALAYLGVLDPSIFIPERCTLQTGLNCNEFIASETGVAMKLANNFGKPIRISKVSFTSEKFSGPCSTGRVNAILENGKTATFYADDPIACKFSASSFGKDTVKIKLNYSYLDSTIAHTATGDLIVKADDYVITPEPFAYGGGEISILGTYSFDTPSQANDEGEYGNNGANVGGAVWGTSNCKNGGCYSFNGGQYIVLADNPTLSARSGLTFAAWIYPTSVVPWKRIGGKAFYSGLDTGSWYMMLSNQANIGCWINTTSGTSFTSIVSPVNSIMNNTPYHVACVYNGTHLAVFINGTRQNAAAKTGTINPSGYNVCIGCTTNNVGSNSPFIGNIDDVRIYNRSLSPEEIYEIATS